MKASVSMGINVELFTGAKYDRFQPVVGIEVDTSLAESEDEQIAHGMRIHEKIFKAISNELERLCTAELNREIKVGD